MPETTRAEVLAGHIFPGEVLACLGDAWFKCACGEKIDLPVEDGKVSNDEIRRLWAEHVDAALTQGQGEAVREAARAIDTLLGSERARLSPEFTDGLVAAARIIRDRRTQGHDAGRTE